MKLKELIDKLPELKDEERLPLRRLVGMLTPLSMNDIMAFQEAWDHSKSYEEFVVAQNEVLKALVELEKGEIGADVRRVLGMPPLTDDTEIVEPHMVTAVVRKAITDNGLIEMQHGISLGHEYRVDLNSIRTIQGVDPKTQIKHDVTVITEENGKWLPVELLYIPGYTQ